jgi:hypothetical protein
MSNKDVYCKYCIHCTPGFLNRSCIIFIKEKTYYEKEEKTRYFFLAEQKNKNNDCKDFKRKWYLFWR